MLSAGKMKFDLILANVNSPDLHGFKLLQQAIAMDIPLILTGVEDNGFLAMRGIENGAYLYLRKPITKEVAICLWQYVTKEKIRLVREKERALAGPGCNAARGGVEIREPGQPGHGNSGDVAEMNKGKSKRNARKSGRDGDGDDDEEEDCELFGYRGAFSGNVKRKVCTEWTQELHDKFVQAVEELGEGRCFPKEILDLMDVPGLTRMQVASHLQKCRNHNWRAPEERRSNSGSQNPTVDPTPSKPRRFGSMPKIAAKTKAAASASKETSRGGGTTTPTAGEGSKTPPGGSDTEVQNGGGAHNVEVAPITVPVPGRNTNDFPPYHPVFVPIGPLPGNVVPPAAATAAGSYPVNNPRNVSEDFLYNFNEMDYTGLSSQVVAAAAAAAGMLGGNIASSSGGSSRFQFEAIYRHHLDQNGGGSSADGRRQRNPGEASANYGSDQDSEMTRSDP
ncbi:Two-component response regulator ARR2 [Striga hermonthica]|uniref:Two-component response regulator ARR2 n=1 Tax=Striga hermonthica TaxID=68872 RepID=A0A9N7MLW2_STRHE|nr:Two-component response regulator ARR2 [Striga hermonthica]